MPGDQQWWRVSVSSGGLARGAKSSVLVVCVVFAELGEFTMLIEQGGGPELGVIGWAGEPGVALDEVEPVQLG